MPGGSMPPIFFCISSSAFRCASLTAATIRSCSISTSSFDTTSGSILIDEELLGAVERDRHHAAAGGGFDRERGHLLLQALLHLLRLLHHLLNLLGIHISSTSRISAGKTSSIAWTPASASASSFNADFRSASPRPCLTAGRRRFRR